MNKTGYGVLASDTHKDVVHGFKREIETRLCLPQGDGSVLTLVTQLGSNGEYEFFVEDANRNRVVTTSGNIYTDTGTSAQ